jgi:regulatory protein YycI of two-component signal transduction system YycFG
MMTQIIIIIIIIIINMDRTYSLIDAAILSERNVIQNEAEKKLKYKNLRIEIQRIWDTKCFVIQ